MIINFKTKSQKNSGLQTNAKSQKFPSTLKKRAYARLQTLHGTGGITELLVPPSNQLEKLKGERKTEHCHSIRKNKQWPICFTWKGNEAHNVTTDLERSQERGGSGVNTKTWNYTVVPKEAKRRITNLMTPSCQHSERKMRASTPSGWLALDYWINLTLTWAIGLISRLRNQSVFDRGIWGTKQVKWRWPRIKMRRV